MAMVLKPGLMVLVMKVRWEELDILLIHTKTLHYQVEKKLVEILKL
jgi:hypothetical protein